MCYRGVGGHLVNWRAADYSQLCQETDFPLVKTQDIVQRLQLPSNLPGNHHHSSKFIILWVSYRVNVPGKSGDVTANLVASFVHDESTHSISLHCCLAYLSSQTCILILLEGSICMVQHPKPAGSEWFHLMQ